MEGKYQWKLAQPTNFITRRALKNQTLMLIFVRLQRYIENLVLCLSNIRYEGKL